MSKSKRIVSVCVLVLGLLVLVLVNRYINLQPLNYCRISPYKVEEYGYSRQKYVVASYPISVYSDYWSEDSSVQVTDYVVEKLDNDGNYRTVYDTSRGIVPIKEELVSENPYSVWRYKEMTLQPLVDIYGEGEYRVLHLGRSLANGSKDILAHRYSVISGEHLTNKERFGVVFGITGKDLENLEIRNGQVLYELTDEERSEFVDFILNMHLSSVNKKTYNDIIMCLAGTANYGYNYRMILNIPDEECYIYSMTGKDLNGNSYQAVFVSGETAVCLDSEENLLYMLDALKQKYNQSIQ